MAEIQKLILILGGWSVILAALFLFIGNNLINRLKIGWEKNAQVTLNKLQGEIDLKNSTITQLLTNHSNSSHLLAEKKLTCFDQYWPLVMQLKELNYGTELLYSYLLDTEIEKLMTDQAPNFQKIRAAELKHIMINYNNISDAAHKNKSTIDRLRPFVGEQLSQLYYVHSMFCMRCTFLLLGGVDKKQSATWKNDSALINMLQNHLTDAELAYILEAKVGSYNLATGILESKMISAIHYSVHGEEVVDKTYLQIEKIKNLLNEQKATTS